MRGCLGCFMYILLTFPIVLGSLFAVAAVQWVLDREFYSEILTDDALFDAFYSDAFPRSFTDDAFSMEFNPEEQSNLALASALREIVPQDYLTTEIRGFVDEFFDFLEGRTDKFDFQLNLVPVRENLMGEPGRRFVDALVASLPECPPGEEQTYGDSEVLSCIPQGVSEQEAAQAIRAVLPDVAADLPALLALQDEPILRDFDWPEFSAADVRSSISSGALVLAGSMLLINALLAGGLRPRRLLLWVGFMLVIPAAIVLASGQGINSEAVTDEIRVEITRSEEGVRQSEVFDIALADTIIDAIRRIGDSFVQVGGFALGLAVVLVLAGFLLPGGGDRKRRGDSDLNLPPSGSGNIRVPRSDSDSPIQGI